MMNILIPTYTFLFVSLGINSVSKDIHIKNIYISCLIPSTKILPIYTSTYLQESVCFSVPMPILDAVINYFGAFKNGKV